MKSLRDEINAFRVDEICLRQMKSTFGG